MICRSEVEFQCFQRMDDEKKRRRRVEWTALGHKEEEALPPEVMGIEDVPRWIVESAANAPKRGAEEDVLMYGKRERKGKVREREREREREKERERKRERETSR